MCAQEEDDAGTAGVLMGGGNSYSSGLFQLLPVVYWEWKLSLLSRVLTLVMASEYGYMVTSSMLLVPCCILVCVPNDIL